MNRTNAGTIRKMAFVAAIGAMFVAGTGCGVEAGADYPPGYYGDDYPPDAYIATTAPVYYDGNPTYWYGGRWYYRDGGRWNHYDREPGGLRERRIGAAPARRVYERPWGHASVHASVVVRGGGHGRR